MLTKFLVKVVEIEQLQWALGSPEDIPVTKKFYQYSRFLE